ncbi:MAG TPA: hypothetical protein VMJ10_34110 [Kofleriaceae bacterium]|nr:hypothetical protein [Kofleriaceae bacterium]
MIPAGRAVDFAGRSTTSIALAIDRQRVSEPVAKIAGTRVAVDWLDLSLAGLARKTVRPMVTDCVADWLSAAIADARIAVGVLDGECVAGTR